MQISTIQAIDQLKASGSLFQTLFQNGSLSVEIYKPVEKDHQQPHTRDEVYIIIAGTGSFYNNDKEYTFKPGDFLFVAAGVEHCFENFTEDFCTWVIFYGPEGGESVN